mmetsp:Transcript_28176/g.95992  ORF Transcript_28176/g.95992 Transcript_28176/m.95992 type:complete len:486 (-) Transcript_28176:16-1473(-)
MLNYFFGTKSNSDAEQIPDHIGEAPAAAPAFEIVPGSPLSKLDAAEAQKVSREAFAATEAPRAESGDELEDGDEGAEEGDEDPHVYASAEKSEDFFRVCGPTKSIAAGQAPRNLDFSTPSEDRTPANRQVPFDKYCGACPADPDDAYASPGLEAILRKSRVDGEGWTPVKKDAKTMSEKKKRAFDRPGVEYFTWVCLGKCYDPPCSAKIRAYRTTDNVLHVYEGRGHTHPPADVRLTHRQSGLAPQVKLALEPLAAHVKYDERLMLRVLKDAGIEPNFKDHGQALKKALKRYVMYLQRDTRRAYWAGTYQELAAWLHGHVLNLGDVDELIQRAALDQRLMHKTFVLGPPRIGGVGDETFVVFSTLSDLLKAVKNRHWVGIDGTGRLNYHGKVVVVVSTVDKRQHGHPIGYFMLSRGEAEAEVLAGLERLRDFIKEATKATLPPGLVMEGESQEGWFQTWDPIVTMRDGALGFKAAFRNFHKSIKA